MGTSKYKGYTPISNRANLKLLLWTGVKKQRKKKKAKPYEYWWIVYRGSGLVRHSTTINFSFFSWLGACDRQNRTLVTLARPSDMQ